MPILGCGIARMKKGVNAIFRYFKNIFLGCDTVSNKTNHNNQSPKDAWLMVAPQYDISKQDSIGFIYDKKMNVTSVTDGNGRSALADTLSLNAMRTKSHPQLEKTYDSSLNLTMVESRDVMEDVNIKLIEMKNMIIENGNEMKRLMEENGKELKSMIEDNRKETKRMIEENEKEMRSMIENDRKGIDRLAGNKKDAYKKIKGQKNKRTSKNIEASTL